MKSVSSTARLQKSLADHSAMLPALLPALSVTCVRNYWKRVPIISVCSARSSERLMKRGKSMAKNPTNQLDEAEIIKRRDDVGGNLPEPLDLTARRSLADARLRAFAFALGTERRANDGPGELEDTELVAYLLDALPEDRRQVMEETLRGDARAFGRLMELRSAFGSQPDERDRGRADDLARGMPRHTLGQIEIRNVRGTLQFQFREALESLPTLQSLMSEWSTRTAARETHFSMSPVPAPP